MTLLIELSNLFIELSYLVIDFLSLLHNSAFLSRVHFLLVEVFAQLPPTSSFTLLLVLHVTLLILIFDCEVVQLFVQIVDSLFHL